MILLVTSLGRAPVVRQALNMKAGIARAAVEFPLGVESVRRIEAPELSDMAQAGYALPSAARALVETYRAVQTVKRQEAARMAKLREKMQAVRDAKREAAEPEKRKVREQNAKAKKANDRARTALVSSTAAAVPRAVEHWDGASPPW